MKWYWAVLLEGLSLLGCDTVAGYVVPNVSKEHSAFIFSIKQSLFLDCHIPEGLNAHQDCWENLRSSINTCCLACGQSQKEENVLVWL